MMPSTRRGRVVVLTLALLAALLSGCSIPTDSSAQRIDASLLPQLNNPLSSTCENLSDVNPAEIPIYFVTGQEETRILAPREREIDRPITPQGALKRLFDCPPTTAEQDEGYTTQVPVTSLEQFIEVEPGYYEIHLTPLRTREGEPVDELNKLAIAQIVYTVTNPDFPEPVFGVRFVIDGEPKASNTDGATKDSNEFVRRSDFTVTQPTTTTTPPTTTTEPVPTTTTAPPSPPTTAAG